MSELLPCPFCGASATIDRVARDWWRVNANHDDDCALDGSHELTVPQTPENRAWAVVAWNRRAARCNDTAPVAPIGKVQRYVQMGSAMCPTIDTGDWVKASDYDALLAAVAAQGESASPRPPSAALPDQ